MPEQIDLELVELAIAQSTRGTVIDPVTVRHERAHPFVKPPKGGRGCKHHVGDGRSCGLSRYDPAHHGPPPSLNDLGGANPHVYNDAKGKWQAMLAEALAAQDLPRGLGRVVAEGECCFPDRRRRDQGNYRYFIEKALGDALVHGGGGIPGGWLEDDDWTRYEFGGLAYRHTPGECWVRVVVFPGAQPAGVDADV
jgi:hypothetical protein